MDQSVPSGAWPELRREADLDLVARLIRGIFPYPILFLLLAITTTYRIDHPVLFWGAAAAIVLTSILRIALMALRERIHARRPAFMDAVFALSVGLASVASGLLYASVLWSYGFETWTFTITMLWIVGQASGCTISFTPSFKLLQLYIYSALGPAILVGLWLGGTEGTTFVLATLVLCVFLLVQGHSLQTAYWRQLRGRALESARTRELELATAAAKAANLSKSQFLAHMSHEIRTPLHGVLGLAQLALGADTLPESHNYVQTLHSSAEGLLRVINDILDFSKVEAGKLTLEQIPFSLRELLDEVRNLLAPQANAKKLELECRVADEVPDVLVGDPARLRQILLNLMGNALKFTPYGSVAINVAAGAVDSDGERISLHFQVRDTGIGIPRDKQATVFEAFGQADSSMTRRFGGTGLGLTICSQLVQLMGGRIWVESTPGTGSTFQFTCTLGIADAADVASPQLAPDAIEAPLRILLAEDNVVNQKVAITLLGKRGHHVTVVSTGVEALRACETEEFDVILMDNQMPEMDGVEAVRRLRAREAALSRGRTPVVSLSASAMIGDRERFLAAGMDGYLAKPFRAHELYALLRHVAHAPVAEPEAPIQTPKEVS